MASRPLRVMCYINQFYAGISGDEAADTELTFVSEQIGVAEGINSILGEKGEVVTTAYCGDDYFYFNKENCLTQIKNYITENDIDLVYCGPAFEEERYSYAVGSIARELIEKNHIAAVASMWNFNIQYSDETKNIVIEEDFSSIYYIMKSTSNRPSGMRKTMLEFVPFGLKIYEITPIMISSSAFQIIIDNDKENPIDLGAPADKIQIAWTEDEISYKCTLQDFFDNWINFKKNNTFVYYGEGNPTDQLPIKVWYDTAPND